MSILDRIDGLYDRVVEHRHRRRVVLWGGRPGRDLQIGSAEDVRRQRMLNDLAAIPRALVPFVAALRSMGRALTAMVDGLYEAFNASPPPPAFTARTRRPGVPATEAIARLQAADRAARTAGVDARPPRGFEGEQRL